jgi:hypothetical protein
MPAGKPADRIPGTARMRPRVQGLRVGLWQSRGAGRGRRAHLDTTTVTQTSQSAVSQASQLAGPGCFRGRGLGEGSASLETCIATRERLPTNGDSLKMRLKSSISPGCLWLCHLSESLIFARIIDHGWHGLHGLEMHPRSLIRIREISEIRGSSRLRCNQLLSLELTWPSGHVYVYN